MKRKVKGKNTMRICSPSVLRLKYEWNHTVGLIINLRCGTADRSSKGTHLNPGSAGRQGVRGEGRAASEVLTLPERGWKQQRSARAPAVDFCAAMPGRASRWPARYWEEHRWSRPRARCAPRIGRSWANHHSR